MNKIRLSYSLLLLWEQGKVDDVVAYYFKLPTTKKTWETAGINYHKGWEDYVVANKKLPEEFGGAELKDPKCEMKLELDGSHFGKEYEWFEFVARIDLLDQPTLHEFKSGVSPIGMYTKSPQTALYGLIASESGYKVEKLVVHHYDFNEKLYETSLTWFTPKRKEDAFDYLTTFGWEILTFFQKEDLFNRYGKTNE